MKTKKFFNLCVNDRIATIDIYSDICSYAWEELGEASQRTVQNSISELEVDEIVVNINSYGGDVKEGIGIYNVLKSHPAKVTTICTGMACSIASVIMMAGDEIIMDNASLLMIHNPWTSIVGNAEELRQTAEELDIMSDMIVKAYLSKVNISESELREMMNRETWISSEDAVKMGFATGIRDCEGSERAVASVKKSLCKLLTMPKESIPEPEARTDSGMDIIQLLDNAIKFI